MKLGSLFDGSGGFPLAGIINGIEPVWAAEIEPYPIRVTKARLPKMKHLGSVLDINGAEIEPVDIITFGSPCQDLSVAGKQKGIHDGERSSLFFEAVRIAKEMREHDRATGRTDVDVRPRFLVWENVPGAFSSNGGEDFRAVLEAIGGIAEDGVSIPRPAKGKWQHAGCVVGDGWSIAWRLYDAQYWGVPQRRKRIYLVADLASERAGEILFERESVRGDPTEGREARQGIADDAQGGAGGSCTAFHLQQDPINGDVSPCIGGQHQATVGVAAAFKGGQGAKAGGIGYQEDVAPTLTHTPSGTQGAPDVVYPAVARTLTAEHDASPCVDRGQNMLCYAPNGNHCGNYEEADVSATLQTRYHYGSGGDGAAVVYDCRGNGDGLHVPTLTGDHGNRVTDYTALCVGNGQLHQMSMAEQSNTLDCMHDQQAVRTQGNHPRKYIIRRLTPLECCRLQGFPDWWGYPDVFPDWTDEDYRFWLNVRNTNAAINGKQVKEYTKEQMLKWYHGLHTDSAEYKMWGNGIALPCAVDVLGRIVKEVADNGQE